MSRAIDADALIDIFEDRFEKIRNRYGDYSGEAGVCAGALHLIRVQPTIEPERTGKWIPCSERLPEHGGWFIVTKDGEGGNKHVFLSWFSTAHGWEFAEEPIAWMPLPEPYREDNT